MDFFLSRMLNRYLSHYSGLSKFCWRGIAASFLQATLSGICYFMSIYLVTMLHFNIAITGIIISCYGLGTILGGIFGGKLSDRFSALTISKIALLAQSVSFLGLTWSKNTAPIIMILFIMGLSSNIFITSNQLSILNHYRNEEALKLRSINTLAVAANLGLGLSAIIISFFPLHDFSYLFLAAAILFCCITIYLLIAEFKTREFHNNLMIKPTSNKIQGKNRSFHTLIIIMICLFFVGTMVSQVSTTYSVYIHKKFSNLGVFSFGFVFFINTFMVFLFQAPIGNMIQNKNKLFIAGFGGLLYGFGLMILAFFHSFTFIIVSCIIFTTGEMLFFPMAQFIFYEHGSNKNKGLYFGAYRTVYAFSRVLGPSIGGFAYHFSSPNIIWYTSGVLGLICFLLCTTHKNNYLSV